MAFKKIRETIAAFRNRGTTQAATISTRTDSAVIKKAENYAVDFILLVGLVYPISIITVSLLHRLIDIEIEGFDTYTSTIVGIYLAFLIGRYHDKIVACFTTLIPIAVIKEKLDPYFGSKLSETLHAFKFKKDH